jgi:hypothetical protein
MAANPNKQPSQTPPHNCPQIRSNASDHPIPTKPQFAPHEAPIPQYGSQSQQTAEPNTSPQLSPDRVQRLQQIVGTILYYARAIDSSMLVALGTLAAAQTRATLDTEKHNTQFSDYAATNPTAAVRFIANAMCLTIQSDANYQSKLQACSRAGGIFYLSSPSDPNKITTAAPPPLNGTIHVSEPFHQPADADPNFVINVNPIPDTTLATFPPMELFTSPVSS